ncbi:MAG: CPBP family intramembrane metalloprotease [Solobacterium sp.]|nr:CPBP family intramembrane metalloprotease [Solobacterium sp.]
MSKITAVLSGLKKDLSDSWKSNRTRREIIETIVTVFVTAYGLDFLGYFLRVRYFRWRDSLAVSAEISHVLLYLGHVCFLAVMLLYAWAVRKDRRYFTDILHGNRRRNALYAVLGALTGFASMGICILAASVHGDFAVASPSGVQIPIFLFGLAAVLLQASTEEIESRGFVFGRLKAEGVPVGIAAAVSAFFFTFLHADNPGFSIIPLLSIFVVGIEYAISFHYFGTLWFPCDAHMMWNFTQDFIFGLPDSGNPAVISIFHTTVSGSSFFYDEVFGIEGSCAAVIVNLIACCIIFLIGRKMQKKEN